MEDFYVSVDEVCEKVLEMIDNSVVYDFIEVFDVENNFLRENFADVFTQILNGDIISSTDKSSTINLGVNGTFLIEYENDVNSTIFKITQIF